MKAQTIALALASAATFALVPSCGNDPITHHYCPKQRIEKPALNGWNRGE